MKGLLSLALLFSKQMKFASQTFYQKFQKKKIKFENQLGKQLLTNHHYNPFQRSSYNLLIRGCVLFAVLFTSCSNVLSSCFYVSLNLVAVLIAV